MTSRSPVLRSALVAVLVTTAISCVGFAAPAVATPPGANTQAANPAGTNTTTLMGAVNTTDGTAVTYHFEYGTTTAYGTSTPSKTVQPPAYQNANVEETVPTMPSTTYHFQIVAVNAGGEQAVGGDRTFTTPAAPSPSAITGDADEVRETSARLNGSGASGDSSKPAFSYAFQYGTTTAYGESTPVAQASAANTQPAEVRQQVSGLASSTEYHFRIVVQDSNGTAVGRDQTFQTAQGPPPYVKPPNSTSVSGTVGAGGSVSTGSDPSSSDPIEVKVTLEKGGKVYLDKIKNPDRPPRNPEAYNPENPGSKITNFYGPAIQYQVVTDVAQTVTVTYTIHPEADQIDGRERNNLARQPGVNPIFERNEGTEEDWECGASSRRQGVHYRANGDLELKVRFRCIPRSGPIRAHFYNQGWGINNEGTGPGFDTSLSRVLDQGYLDTTIYCSLKCSRSAKATISPATAKALGLKSGTLAEDRSGPRVTLKDEFDPARKAAELQLRLSKKVRRALKRAKQITVSFHMKAVGPDGQVWKRTEKLKFKMEDDSDSVN